MDHISEYWLEPTKDDLACAIWELRHCSYNTSDIGGRLRFDFERGWLTLTRTTWMDAVIGQQTIFAYGRWKGSVSIEWNDAERLLDDCWAPPFYLVFSPQSRDFRAGSTLIEGRDDSGQRSVSAKTPTVSPSPDEAAYQALIERIAAIDAEKAGTPPAKIQEVAERYERDAELVRLLKQARGHRCQICGGTFRMRNGDSYTEAHHLEELANGGLDVSRNMLIVCANHHRQFHFGDVEIVKHTAEQIVVQLDAEVHVIPLTFASPTEFAT
jgi:hypothetical protein